MKWLFALMPLISFHAYGCPLQGAWRTDIEKTSASVSNSASLSDEKKLAVVSILDEFEAVFTCDTITLRHVGDHDFGGPVADKTARYELTELADARVSLTIFDEEGNGHTEVARFDSAGCFVIEDKFRGYEEFKCKVVVQK